jgi:hypothetical protein
VVVTSLPQTTLTTTNTFKTPVYRARGFVALVLNFKFPYIEVLRSVAAVAACGNSAHVGWYTATPLPARSGASYCAARPILPLAAMQTSTTASAVRAGGSNSSRSSLFERVVSACAQRGVSATNCARTVGPPRSPTRHFAMKTHLPVTAFSREESAR